MGTYSREGGFDDGLTLLFEHLDSSGDGEISRVELKRALNNPQDKSVNNTLRRTLGLPASISGRFAREVFEMVFECVDMDGTHTLSAGELREFVADMDHLEDIVRELRDKSFAFGSASGDGQQDAPKSPAAGDKGSLPAWVTPEVVEALAPVEVWPNGKVNHVNIIMAMKDEPNLRDAARARQAAGVASAAYATKVANAKREMERAEAIEAAAVAAAVAAALEEEARKLAER